MCNQKTLAATIAAFSARIYKTFFNLGDTENVTTTTYKVGKLVSMRIIYSIADYWLMALSGAFIILMDQYFGYGPIALFLLMWGFDIIVANAFVVIWWRTGEDVTLGESYRRVADAIHASNKLAGYLAFASVAVKAAFWDGPEHIVIFFHKELKTEANMLLVLLALTAVQAAIWTPIYVLGFDTITQLFEYLVHLF